MRGEVDPVLLYGSSTDKTFLNNIPYKPLVKCYINHIQVVSQNL